MYYYVNYVKNYYILQFLVTVKISILSNNKTLYNVLQNL